MNDKNEIIGVDPLAWLNEDDVQEYKEELKAGPENSVEERTDDTDAEVINATAENATESSGSEVDENGHTAQLVLDGHFDIRHMESFHKEVGTLIDESEVINVDLSLVEKTDTSALQHLYAFKKVAEDRSITVNWHEPTDYLIKSIELLGLSNALDIHN